MRDGYFFAGGSVAKADAAKVITCAETGAPRIENDVDETDRKRLIRAYYDRGNRLCMSWSQADRSLGERLRETASRLQAFPLTYFHMSPDTWEWGLFGFVAAPDLD